MNKMPDAFQQDILNTLTKIVHETNNGMSPTDAIVKVAGDKGYSIPTLQRICEAFNKSKSIHKLTNTPQEKRAEDYSLADPHEVISRLFVEEKTAEHFEPPKLKDIDIVKKPVEKKAEAPKEKPIAFLYNDFVKKAHREKFALDQADKKVREYYLQTELAINEAARQLQYHTPKEMLKIARRIVNKYGAKGNQLINLCFAKLGKEAVQLEKTAHTVIFSPEEPYISLTRAMDNMLKYNKAVEYKTALEKQGAVATDFLSGLGLASLRKSLTAKGAPPIDELLTYKKKVKGESILTPEFTNKLNKFRTKSLFVDIYNDDPFINKHNIDEVAKAYNDVISFFPTLIEKPNARPLMTTLVKKRLAEGDSFDPTELIQLAAVKKRSETTPVEVRALREIQEENKPEQPQLGQIATAPGGTIRDILTSITEGAVKGVTKAKEHYSKTIENIEKEREKLTEAKRKEKEHVDRMRAEQDKKRRDIRNMAWREWNNLVNVALNIERPTSPSDRIAALVSYGLWDPKKDVPVYKGKPLT